MPEPDAPRVAKYAFGNDYHEVIRGRLNQLLDKMRAAFGDIEGRAINLQISPARTKAAAEGSVNGNAQLEKGSPLSWAAWALVALVGAFSLGVVALHRGETINALWLVTAARQPFYLFESEPSQLAKSAEQHSEGSSVEQRCEASPPERYNPADGGHPIADSRTAPTATRRDVRDGQSGTGRRGNGGSSDYIYENKVT